MNAGARVQLATIDTTIGQDLVYPEVIRWNKAFAQAGFRAAPHLRLAEVRKSGNRLEAVLMNELTHLTEERIVDQVVVDMGTIPIDDTFIELRERSGNDGVTDLHALKELVPQPVTRDGFELHRIGDALASRNVHAAIYDALRLCSVC